MKTSWLGLVILAMFLAESTAHGQDYVGDETCALCHPGRFDDYMLSGHPWKIHRIAGEEPFPDTWPFTPVPPLPPVVPGWGSVEYVIGNYFWKARFIQRDGFIWTGGNDDKTQWNLHAQEFVPYHPGETRPFNCGKCHTTGYNPEGNQHGLDGLVGTWAQDGVRCEACHGPGSEHFMNPDTVAPPGGKDCAECHFRDSQFRMPWKGGFTRHHQQAEDLLHSPHFDFDCDTCHNPHKSVVYNLGGTITECSDCHPGSQENGFYTVAGMEFIDCLSCHMPFMGKSAAATNPFSADIRGHLFRVMTDPVAREENVYEADGKLFWNQDDAGASASTLDYSCLGCHYEFDSDFTVADAAAFAKDVHTRHPAGVQTVSFLVKQKSVNLESNGVLPVAIVGSEDLDVSEIDVSSVLLQGQIAPERSNLAGKGKGRGSDSALLLDFSIQALADALGTADPGEEYEVWITGNLMDGTPISGSDSVVLVPR